MVLNRPGAQFIHEGITYTIGSKVLATDESEYEGLTGVLFEVRDGADMETDNDGPDFYCEFTEPTDSTLLKKMEERFSKLYGEDMTLDDINISYVIMAADMIQPIHDTETEPSADYFVQLHNKVREEYSALLNCLQRLPAADIIDRSYEKVIKEELVSCLEAVQLDGKSIYALCKLRYPLDYIYQHWLKNDYSIHDMLYQTVQYTAQKLLRANDP